MTKLMIKPAPAGPVITATVGISKEDTAWLIQVVLRNYHLFFLYF